MIRMVVQHIGQSSPNKYHDTSESKEPLEEKICEC